MSEDNKSQSALDDSAIWDDVDRDPDKANSDASGFEDPGLGIGDDPGPDDVIDTTAKPVQAKSKAVYVIGLIAVLVVAFAGYIGYSLYSKLFAPDQGGETSVSGGSIMLDEPAAFPGSSQTSLAAPSTIPMSTDPVPASDTAAAVQPTDSVQVDPPVPSPPLAALVDPAPSCPQVVAPVCPVVQAEKAIEPKKPSVRRVDKASAQARSGSRTAKASAPSAAPDPVAADLGRLSGFRVLAIEPKTGNHQQAWLRGSDGRMHIVREGESFLGARVVSVSFVDGTVKTTAGDIRK